MKDWATVGESVQAKHSIFTLPLNREVEQPDEQREAVEAETIESMEAWECMQRPQRFSFLQWRDSRIATISFYDGKTVEHDENDSNLVQDMNENWRGTTKG